MLLTAPTKEESIVKKRAKINLLVTLDKNYIPYLNTMLSSLLWKNPDCAFDVYLLHSSIKEKDLEDTREILGKENRMIPVQAMDIGLGDAPTTARYPQEIYYRIFAAKYLPKELDRVLYLDPDIIVNGSVRELYSLPLENYYFAAASHNKKFLRKVNGVRLDMDAEDLYINSGVMLMNLERLRKEQDFRDVFDFIERKRNVLVLPDQDIISGLYGDKIYALDTLRYNMTEILFQLHGNLEKEIDMDWVKENSVIIHYCGRNKPWKENYIGQLDGFYNETVKYMEEKNKEKGKN